MSMGLIGEFKETFMARLNTSYFSGIGVGLVAGAISGAAGQGTGTIALVTGIVLICIGSYYQAEQQIKEKIKKLDAEAVKPS